MVVSPLLGADGRPERLLAISRDVTERRSAQEARAQSEQRFQFLSELAAATADLPDPEAVMAVITRRLGEHLKVSRCAYAEVEADGDAFTIRHDHTVGCASAVGRYQLSDFGPEPAAQLRAGHTLLIADLDADPPGEEVRQRFAAIQIQATVSCPLLTAGRLVAMMAVHQMIIEDLLDMSRIISGKVRLNVQRTNLASVIEAALETIRPAATAKGIRLQAVLDPRAMPVSGDPNRLQRVFWNLLSNAVKFTPRGGRVGLMKVMPP